MSKIPPNDTDLNASFHYILWENMRYTLHRLANVMFEDKYGTELKYRD